MPLSYRTGTHGWQLQGRVFGQSEMEISNRVALRWHGFRQETCSSSHWRCVQAALDTHMTRTLRREVMPQKQRWDESTVRVPLNSNSESKSWMAYNVNSAFLLLLMASRIMKFPERTPSVICGQSVRFRSLCVYRTLKSRSALKQTPWCPCSRAYIFHLVQTAAPKRV